MVMKLRMTGKQHADITSHVITPDGFEAGTLLICEPVFREESMILLVKEISHIPYEACGIRTPVSLTWPTEQYLLPLYEYLESNGLSLIILHSHPAGFSDFSSTDNENDLKILSRLTASIEGKQPHGSAIMLPDGEIKARVMDPDEKFISIDLVSIAGDDIKYFSNQPASKNDKQHFIKSEQVFGAGTTDIMQLLKAGVVGCSGTGSPAIELLYRNHIGHIVPVDFDKTEEGNLNRMLMSRAQDAHDGTLKSELYARWIEESGLPTKVTPINDILPSKRTIEALADCDVLFGCIDNVAARHALNKIATAYLIPYFDIGVVIKENKKQPGQLRQVLARCHYLQPDQSCLLDREAFSSERLRDENFRQDSPEFYKKLKELGYTQERNGIQAVMTLTMEAAVMALDDFLARLHGYRIEANKEFDEQERSFTHGYYEHRSHSKKGIALKLFLATGDKHKEL